MCGIAGGFGRPDTDRVEDMLDTLRHRGPDGRGLHRDPGGRCVLGHTRLAIIDVAGGHQPMANETGTVWVAFNGEIYNFRELRRELTDRGHRFRTGSDTEVLVHLYEDLGPEMVRRLDGMFALALWDGKDLFLARDRLGIKPLYYGYAADGTLYFASELKALRRACGEAQEFPAGSWFRTGEGFRRYYTVPGRRGIVPDPGGVEGAVRRLRALLEAAVAKRLMADVPVGVFLSGGLDSSLVAAIARRLTAGPLHSFAVGTRGSLDLASARRVAAHLGTVHHEFVFDEEDVARALPDVIHHLESFDPALVRSAVATWFVSRLASEHVKVVLMGEGADELFAGYEYLGGLPDASLQGELVTLTGALHNTNLQRADRMTMAWSLEGRVPFLDRALVEFALEGVPPAWKLRPRGVRGEPAEKWILRLAAGADLPDEIAWRRKEKFSHGTGASALLARLAAGAVSDAEVRRTRLPGGRSAAVSREEILYYRVYDEFFPGGYGAGTVGRTRSVVPGEIPAAAAGGRVP